MRATFAVCLFGGFAAALLPACSGDDNGSANAVEDGGTHDSSVVADGGGADGASADGSTTAADSAGGDAADGSPTALDSSSVDGSEGGPCDFATFVIGLVENDTTMAAQPSVNLGQSCVDEQNQAQFTVLFQ
ncbi:MAG: hypothetical protein ABSC94_06665 [Polyangiaceae bacterium]|jgi:hypothetical protein